MRRSLCLTGLLGLALVVALTACGTQNAGLQGADQTGTGREGAGVKLQGFEVIRYNDAGRLDPALNPTLDLRLEQEPGGTQALIIAVDNPGETQNVIVDVHYNSGSVHPQRVQFHGLLGSGEQVLGGAFLSVAGTAGLGEVAIRDYRATSPKGDFATVYFESGAVKNASAAGDQYVETSNHLGVAIAVNPTATNLNNLFASSDTDAQTASVTWTAAWQRGDGNNDGKILATDLGPIGLNFLAVPSLSWSALPADYNDDNRVLATDIGLIGLHFLEGTDNYRVEASDNSGGPRSPVGQPLWGDGADPSDPQNNNPGASSADLQRVFRSWTVDFNAGSTFSYASLSALDVDADGFVRVFVTPTRASSGVSVGDEAFIDVEVGDPVIIPTKDVLTITGLEFEVTDAASAPLVFGGGQTAVEANEQYTFTLTGIAGTWNGGDGGTGPFTSDPGSFPTNPETSEPSMTQADYDLAFNAATAQTAWIFGDAGDPAIRRSASWITFGSPSPITGDPGLGTVFPDDDPESDATNPEGTMTVRVPAEVPAGSATYPNTADLDVNCPNDVAVSVTFDVEEDLAAALLGTVTDQNGLTLDELTLQIDSEVRMPITFGEAGVPVDLSATQLQLAKIEGNTATEYVDFNFIPEGPVETGGEYIVEDRGLGYFVTAMVSGINLDAGATYHFRFNDGSQWTSLNKPTEAMTTKDPPPPQELKTLPKKVTNLAAGDNGTLQVFFAEPMVRRNYRVIVSILDKTANPDPAFGGQIAYDDVLKDGAEFAIQFGDTAGIFPRVVIIEGASAASITPTTETIPGTQIVGTELQPGRLVLDIVNVRPVAIEEGSVSFSYKIFNKFGGEVGHDTFTKDALPVTQPQIAGKDWGINAFDRSLTQTAAQADYSDKTVSGSTVGSVTPDVLFVQYNGGYNRDYNESAISNNVRITLEDWEGGLGVAPMRMSLRIAGLTATNDIIAMHVINSNDFLQNPFTGGILSTAVSNGYNIYLNNPSGSYVSLCGSTYGSGESGDPNFMLFVDSDLPGGG